MDIEGLKPTFRRSRGGTLLDLDSFPQSGRFAALTVPSFCSLSTWCTSSVNGTPSLFVNFRKSEPGKHLLLVELPLLILLLSVNINAQFYKKKSRLLLLLGILYIWTWNCISAQLPKTFKNFLQINQKNCGFYPDRPPWTSLWDWNKQRVRINYMKICYFARVLGVRFGL